MPVLETYGSFTHSYKPDFINTLRKFAVKNSYSAIDCFLQLYVNNFGRILCVEFAYPSSKHNIELFHEHISVGSEVFHLMGMVRNHSMHFSCAIKKNSSWQFTDIFQICSVVSGPLAPIELLIQQTKQLNMTERNRT